jgi:protein-arginine kinase activator protein McsA
MLCDLCQQKTATIHLTLCEGGKPPFLADLCGACAESFGWANETPSMPPTPRWSALKEAIATAKRERGD